MKNYMKTYEQYCCVLKRNIVLEETVFCNGTSTLHCTHYGECKNSGGCKNVLIEPRLNNRTKSTEDVNLLTER